MWHIDYAKRGVTITDWDDRGFGQKFWQIVARIDAAGAQPDVVIGAPIATAKRKDGTTPVVAVITFDGNKIRDTWVHGWACDAGYVASIST